MGNMPDGKGASVPLLLLLLLLLVVVLGWSLEGPIENGSLGADSTGSVVITVVVGWVEAGVVGAEEVACDPSGLPNVDSRTPVDVVGALGSEAMVLAGDSGELGTTGVLRASASGR
jgi:hypothetical protein